MRDIDDPDDIFAYQITMSSLPGLFIFGGINGPAVGQLLDEYGLSGADRFEIWQRCMMILAVVADIEGKKHGAT